jgi:XTP/dITP diphosphohydrolase
VKLLLATGSEHKRRELAALLAPHEVEPLPPGVDLGPELGETFAENALGKARVAAAATGRPAIADDSGIEAQALGGRPGVYSRRYAGEQATDAENLAKLLHEAPAGSGLTYVCAIAHVDPASGAEHVFEGRCTGRVAERPRGAGGFGYDPAFLPDDGPPGLTMAELPDGGKHAISHRGRAARALLDWLQAPTAD